MSARIKKPYHNCRRFFESKTDERKTAEKMKVQLLRKISIGRENCLAGKVVKNKRKSSECASNWHAGGGDLSGNGSPGLAAPASADTSHAASASVGCAGCHPPQLFVNNSVSLLTSERAAACLLSAGRVRLCDVDDIHCFPPPSFGDKQNE